MNTTTKDIAESSVFRFASLNAISGREAQFDSNQVFVNNLIKNQVFDLVKCAFSGCPVIIPSTSLMMDAKVDGNHFTIRVYPHQFGQNEEGINEISVMTIFGTAKGNDDWSFVEAKKWPKKYTVLTV